MGGIAFANFDVIPFPTPRSLVADQAQQSAPVALTPRKTVQETYTSDAPAPTGNDTQRLKAFFTTLEKKDEVGAVRALKAISNPLDRDIARFMVATSGLDGFRHQTLKNAASQIPNWPGQTLMLRRQEEAIVRAKVANGTTLNGLAKRPQTDDGKLLQLRALVNTGNRERAAARLRDYWVSENFTAAIEAEILGEFGNLLRREDHTARVERLLYDERASGALRLRKFIAADDRLLLDARVAVIRKQNNADALLRQMPERIQKKPGYYFAVVQHLRRKDQWLKAAQVLNAAPKQQNLLVDPDEWWIERRLVSRKVLEAGHPKLAYELASQHAAKRAVRKVDAEFHAGWYALRFLNAPKTARAHFEKIRSISKRPLSQSRALYWIGRSFEAEGNRSQARAFYQAAAKLPFTYYGQLALEELGGKSIALAEFPNTAGAEGTFNKLLFVRVIQRLNQIDREGRTGIFYRHIAQTLKKPAHVMLLSNMAERQGYYQIALQVGKTALGNGLNVPRIAYPLGAISGKIKLQGRDKALAYAIARQESAFDIAARSSADARGLMQLLPATAKITARKIGLPYRPRALTTDGAYNAKLGTAFLKELIERFNGSYILAFAGYNAGPGRSDQWIERFGDPRKNRIDAIDWVEWIPFSETRNYVQRVMENYQVYKFRLQNAPLTISRDLNRGQPS